MIENRLVRLTAAVHFILTLLSVTSIFTNNADASFCQVKSYQKISDTEGDFTGDIGPNDRFGNAEAYLGDLDGDGVGDIAVGEFIDGEIGEQRGAVWILFLDSDGTVKAHQKIAANEGGFTDTLDIWDEFGFSLASLGDLDGDGVVDLAVGACLDDDGGTNCGAVWILFLDTDGTVKMHQKISATEGGFAGVLTDSDRFGSSLATLSDFDGDGVNDLAVGAPFDRDGGYGRGAVWLLYLNSDGTVKDHRKISSIQGGFNGVLDDSDHFGSGLTFLGDFDSDGIADIAVGATGDDDGGIGRGAVWLLYLDSDGTVKDHRKISDTQGGFAGTLDDDDAFGASLAKLDDFDCDGTADLVVGAPLDDDGGTNRGAVWLLFLDGGGTVKDHRKISDISGAFTGWFDDDDEFGLGVAAVQDFNGDGVEDIVVGASKDDDGDTDQGAVWLLHLAQCFVDPSELNFDYVALGSWKDTTFTIINYSCSTQVGEVSESCPYYSIVSGGGPYTLAVGESLSVTVRFEPTEYGVFTCMVETGGDWCGGVYCVGTGGETGCVVDPATLAFGWVEPGGFRDSSFIIVNLYNDPLFVDVEEYCYEFYILSGGGYHPLDPGETLVVTVRYDPPSGGRDQCTVETGNGLCYDVLCTGNTCEPRCYVSPTVIDFGMVPIGSSMDEIFRIDNACGDTLSGIVSESSPDFSIVSGGGPYVLPQDERIWVTVRYEPTSYDQHTCTIETGNDLCFDVSCTGTGYEPGLCSKDGDPGLYYGFGEEIIDVVPGETRCWTLTPMNFGFVSGNCPGADTFCIHLHDTRGWLKTGEPPLEECFILEEAFFWYQDVYVTVPCDAFPADYDTVVAVMMFCNAELECVHGCKDLPECEDPNHYAANLFYSSDTIVLCPVETPPSLLVVQDSIYFVEEGQSAAHVPFTICNASECAPPIVYDFTISSTGHVSAGFPQSGSTDPIGGGDCGDVYAVVNAAAAAICDLDTLTIIVWDQATGSVYDTCVQIVHVVEPAPVPLFTGPVLIVLVLVIILAAAKLLNRRREVTVR